eukprot:1394203-Amorphochlora_amoeboformis.AAC.1
MGQGLDTRVRQVVALELNIDPSQVRVRETSTFAVPNTPPTTMVSTDMAGEAAARACKEILNSMPQDEKIPWIERVSKAGKLSAVGKISYPKLAYDWEKLSGDISYFFVWGAALSVVEIDVETGLWTIVRTDVLQDTGRYSLNPALDIGQVEGGFSMGLGYYMMEEMIYDPSNAALFSNSLTRYKIPAHSDMPRDWHVKLFEYSEDDQEAQAGIYGTKAIGEASLGLSLSVYYAMKDAIRRSRDDTRFQAMEVGFPGAPHAIKTALDRL